MSRKISDETLIHARKFIENGGKLKDFATLFMCSPDALSKKLRASGFVIPRRVPAGTNKLALPEAEMIARYRAGENVLTLARAYGISRAPITAMLKRHGIAVRSISQTMVTMHQRMTPEERSRRAVAAHEAIRNKPDDDFRQLRRRAAQAVQDGTRKIMTGPGETEIAKALEERGHGVIRQKAVDTYNVDIAFGSVAVEVKFGPTGRLHSLRNLKRLEKISEAHKLVIVVLVDTVAISDATDYIVALLESVDRNPAAPGHYWMIRSGLQTSPLTRNRNHRAGIMAPVELVTTIRQVNFR